MDDPDGATIASREQELSMLRGLLAAGRAVDVVKLLDGWTPRERSVHPESLTLLADAHLALGSTSSAIDAARLATSAATDARLLSAATASLAFALCRRADRPALDEARRLLDPAAAAVR